MTAGNQIVTVIPPVTDADVVILAEASKVVSDGVAKALDVFLSALTQGSAVRVEPLSTMLTTGQAAEILNVSRMTVVKLLDEGAMPYLQPRTHRMIKLDDVMAYKEQRSKARREFFQQSAAEAIADGSFEVTFNQAISAVREVRKHRQAQAEVN